MVKKKKVVTHSLFTEYDIYLFKSGKHSRIYEKLGNHWIEEDEIKGSYFAVYAPNAEFVQVIGNFNNWMGGEHELFARWDESGIWEGLIPEVKLGELYKYSIQPIGGEERLEKADPYAKFCELRPSTASITWQADHDWSDQKWMRERKTTNGYETPNLIYEIHLGSWKWHEDGRPFTYRELAPQLIQYITKMGFTHVEIMPIMEFPYDPSWGYQITGYFAPTSRFGPPEDFKYLIDQLHQSGIGVILDWVPSHFPEDGHGLANFDGSALYEHPDPRRGYHPDWSSMIFNYGNSEVKSFLISNAIYWFEQYHVDGLRVDAVASMLYLDYSRNDGEWEANIHGGNENLEAIAFLQQMNQTVYGEFPDVMTIAEESTSFANVTSPVDQGGLGFGYKWMMGWMHDTLKYFKEDSLFRTYHHETITFSLFYAFSENFLLPFSHDEVVHGKGSLLGKMPGDEWNRFANLRLMYAYMYFHPGSKLLFMGTELAQYQEWSFERELDWNLLDYPLHRGIHQFVSDLNAVTMAQPALYEKNYDESGFEWIEYQDHKTSVISFYRRGHESKNDLIIICNLTAVQRDRHQLKMRDSTNWDMIFNSDWEDYGGLTAKADDKNKKKRKSFRVKSGSVFINIPPLTALVFKQK